jgi:CRISPR-associated protein Cas1
LDLSVLTPRAFLSSGFRKESLASSVLIARRTKSEMHSPRLSDGYQTKQSLVYDLQEPFRWIVDVAVMDAFESGVLDLPDFFFTGDDYRYRFDPEAKQRFLGLLRERFNSGVRYNGRALKWNTVVEQKTLELARYLLSRSNGLDFSEPSPTLDRTDDMELRKRILSLSQSEAVRFGIRKGTLHHLRENLREGRPFRLYRKTRNRLLRASSSRG